MATGQRRRGTSRYAHLLEEDQAFRAWYRNVLRGSYNTAAWYLLRMGRLCDEVTRTTPARIAAMNRAELMTYVSGFVSDLEERGSAGRCGGRKLNFRFKSHQIFFSCRNHFESSNERSPLRFLSRAQFLCDSGGN